MMLLLFYQSLITSGCVEHLDFLDKIGDPSDIFVPFEEKTVGASFKSLTEIPKLPQLNDATLRYNEQVKTNPIGDEIWSNLLIKLMKLRITFFVFT